GMEGPIVFPSTDSVAIGTEENCTLTFFGAGISVGATAGAGGDVGTTSATAGAAGGSAPGPREPVGRAGNARRRRRRREGLCRLGTTLHEEIDACGGGDDHQDPSE